MVHKVGADAGQVFDHRDAEPLEQVTRPDAAELEDLGGVDSAGRQDDLLLGGYRNLPRRVASAVDLHPLGLGLPDLDLAHVTVDEKLQIGPVLGGIVVGRACRGPCLVLAVGAVRPPRNTDELAVHAPVVEEREPQVVGPGSIQVVYYCQW